MNRTRQNKNPEAAAEKNHTGKAHTAKAGAGKIKWIVGALLLLFAAAAVMNLPRGYSDDLSRIGKGQAAVVLDRKSVV